MREAPMKETPILNYPSQFSAISPSASKPTAHTHTHNRQTNKQTKAHLPEGTEGQHRVETEEPDQASYELVVGNHLHQVLALILALALQHGGGCEWGVEVVAHIWQEAWCAVVVAAQHGHCALQDLAQLGGVQVHCFVGGPP